MSRWSKKYSHTHKQGLINIPVDTFIRKSSLRGGKAVGKYLLLGEIDRTQTPVNLKECANEFNALMKVIKQDKKRHTQGLRTFCWRTLRIFNH
jgi:hypothetical protein